MKTVDWNDMGITVQWDNESKTVIRQTFDGQWTWDEFYQKNNVKIPTMMKEVAHTVHVFSDFTSSDVPSMGGALKHANNVLDAYPDNWGMLVVVGGNTMINLLVNMFRSLFKNSVGGKTFTAQMISDAYKLVDEFEEEQR